MIDKIVHRGKLVALIVRRDFNKPGIHFFTPNDFSQQLAYMRHPAGKTIEPHRHNPVPRSVEYTQEVLLINAVGFGLTASTIRRATWRAGSWSRAT